MSADAFGDRTPAITLVREGMPVVDVNGEKLGKVKDVRLGDPGAVTGEGQTPVDDDGPPASAAHHLARTGYLRIHKGLFGGDSWVSGDDVASVDDDETVHLSIDEGRLIR
ncbi:MAG: PRC-barrel domain-containing protein [Actinotalea sp.]|nr:PRC-barrel domain-containing protein [Actinotalea sp.]